MYLSEPAVKIVHLILDWLKNNNTPNSWFIPTVYNNFPFILKKISIILYPIFCPKSLCLILHPNHIPIMFYENRVDLLLPIYLLSPSVLCFQLAFPVVMPFLHILYVCEFTASCYLKWDSRLGRPWDPARPWMASAWPKGASLQFPDVHPRKWGEVGCDVLFGIIVAWNWGAPSTFLSPSAWVQLSTEGQRGGKHGGFGQPQNRRVWGQNERERRAGQRCDCVPPWRGWKVMFKFLCPTRKDGVNLAASA